MKNLLQFLLPFFLIVSIIILIYNSKVLIEQKSEIEIIRNQLIESNEKDNIFSKTWLAKENPTVVLLGSSVTQGAGASSPEKTWAGLLQSFFQRTNPDVDFINLGVSGYTTQALLRNSLPVVSNLNPDVIIIENCLINDFYTFDTSQSKSNIERLITNLTTNHPSARIFLMPPNNIASNNIRNSEGLLYSEYVSIVGGFIKTKGWYYIDFWDEYEKDYMNQGLTIEQTLTQDKIHPNDIGYKIWFNSIKNNFKVSK